MLKKWIRKALDPKRQAGVFAKPAYTYKGSEIAIVASARPKTTVDAVSLAAPRFEAIGAKVPSDRKRIVSATVEEVWSPVYASVHGDDVASVFRALAGGMPAQTGWVVAQVTRSATCDCPGAKMTSTDEGLVHLACARPHTRVGVEHVEDFAEHIQSLTMVTGDSEIYNGFYGTLPGNDVAHHNADAKGMDRFREGMAIKNTSLVEGVLRGGTEIKGGRAEHRRQTKGMIEVGPGYMRDIEKIQAAKKAKKVAENRMKIERIVAQAPIKFNEL